jgi:hypothetical protein
MERLDDRKTNKKKEIMETYSCCFYKCKISKIKHFKITKNAVGNDHFKSNLIQYEQ